MATRRTVTHEGVEYLLGSAGSLIVACPKCGEEHFREARNYFGPEPLGNPSWHKCFECGSQMEPIAIRDLSRWRRFWRSLGWNVTPTTAGEAD